jgi:hypothetical protein
LPRKQSSYSDEIRFVLFVLVVRLEDVSDQIDDRQYDENHEIRPIAHSSCMIITIYLMNSDKYQLHDHLGIETIVFLLVS